MIGAMFTAFRGTEQEDEGFSPRGIGDGFTGVHHEMITRASSEGASPMVALTCTLWSTIALGALVQGRPKDTVSVRPAAAAAGEEAGAGFGVDVEACFGSGVIGFPRGP